MSECSSIGETFCQSRTLRQESPIHKAVKSSKVEAFPVNFVAARTYGALTRDGSFLLLRDRGSRDIYSLDLNLP